MYASTIKRVLDIAFALIVLPVIFPVGILIAVAIKLESKGPVLFKQQRVGKDAKTFVMYKFRSMRTDTPNLPTWKFKNVDEFITKLGRLLRKTSLDELPQLINVLAGNMSIIGPRPGAVENENELIVERKKYDVFKVRPGITGWAQVNGRDELAANVPQKVAYDSEYVSNISLSMDLRCLYMTVLTILNSDGYSEGVVSPSVQNVRITNQPQTTFYAKVSSSGNTRALQRIRRRSHQQLPKSTKESTI